MADLSAGEVSHAVAFGMVSTTAAAMLSTYQPAGAGVYFLAAVATAKPAGIMPGAFIFIYDNKVAKAVTDMNGLVHISLLNTGRELSVKRFCICFDYTMIVGQV